MSSHVFHKDSFLCETLSTTESRKKALFQHELTCDSKAFVTRESVSAQRAAERLF